MMRPPFHAAGRAALLVSTLILAGALPGCTALPGDVARRVDAGERQGARMVRDVGQVEARGQNASAVVRDNGMWIGRSTVRREPAALPPLFEQNATFDRSVASLAEFAERVTLRSGIAVRVSADAVVASSRAGAVAGMTGATPVAGALSATATAAIRIVYPGGSFRGLLDAAAARFGVSWKYADGAILFFHTAPAPSRSTRFRATPRSAPA